MSVLGLLNRPWMHFIVLGLGLFVLQATVFPPPKPVVGPLAEARLEALQRQFRSSRGRSPSPEEQARMVAAELERDMLLQRAVELELHLGDAQVRRRLVRNMRFLGLDSGRSETELFDEALAMRLHLGDEIARRRLIQLMKRRMLAANPPAVPSEQDLRSEFERRRDEMRSPPRLSFSHLYFERSREGEVDAAVARIEQEKLTPEQALKMSSPFPRGHRFHAGTPDQLSGFFGAAFIDDLMATDPQPGSWRGPVRSAHGLHYVWVEALEPSRALTLREARPRLRRELESRARSATLRESLARMREDFEVRQ